jgi:hypothetical protein
VIVLLASCGSTTDDKAPPPAAKVVTPPPSPPTKPVEKKPAPPPPAKVATCSDGDTKLYDTTIGASGARFCLGDDKVVRSCWSFALATGAIQPSPLSAAAEPNAIAVPDEPPEPKSAWSAKHDEEKVEVCGPAGCAPFKLAPHKADDDAAAITDAQVSPTGTLVAVNRGMMSLAHASVEIYDRASGKRLGVARPKSMCTQLMGFAGSAIVLQDWDCINKGGDRELVAPTGKTIARLTTLYTPMDGYLQLDDKHWVFTNREGTLDIFDLVAGKRTGGHALEEDARVVAANGKLYAFSRGSGRVMVLAATGKQLAAGRVPPCRFEWETQAIGPLHLKMTREQLAKALGEPAKRTPPNTNNFFATTWTYASGVTVHVQASNMDPNSNVPRPVPPFYVTGIALAAPSKLLVGGVGIGSTRAQVDAAFGAHALAAHTSQQQLFAGNGDETDGLVFEFKDGKVARIAIGDSSSATTPDE